MLAEPVDMQSIASELWNVKEQRNWLYSWYSIQYMDTASAPGKVSPKLTVSQIDPVNVIARNLHAKFLGIIISII